MLRRVVTKEARINQIVQSARQTTLEGSIQMALKNLQMQIQALNVSVNDLAIKSGRDYDEQGNLDTVGRAARTTARLTNRSGVGVNLGTVVVLHPTESESFTVTTVSGDKNVIGVVATDKAEESEYAVKNGDDGLVCLEGIALVAVNADGAPINIGDGLIAHTVAGTAVAADPENPGIFATALEALPSGSGTIHAFVRAGVLAYAPAVEALQNFDHSLFERDGYYVAKYDVDGTATGFSGFITSATLWTGAGMSQYMGHWTFGYGADGMLVSSVHSVYGMDGDGLCTVRRAIEYQDGRIASIISALS